MYVFLWDWLQWSNHMILTSPSGEGVVCSETCDTEIRWGNGKMCHRWLNLWLGPDYLKAFVQGSPTKWLVPIRAIKCLLLTFFSLFHYLQYRDNNPFHRIIEKIKWHYRCIYNSTYMWFKFVLKIIFNTEQFLKLVTMVLPPFISCLRIFSKEGKLQKELIYIPLSSWNLQSYVQSTLLGFSSISTHNFK